MRKILMICLMAGLSYLNANAITVMIDNTDELLAGGHASTALIETMQNNLARVLNEINAAHEQKREPNTAGLPIDEFAARMLVTLWGTSSFYCDEELVTDHCWPLTNTKKQKSFLLRQVPLILTPEDEAFAGLPKETYQEASIEFDTQGNIIDFRFSLGSQLSEGMEKCGTVASAEQAAVIWKLVEQFRTAYCTKDLDFMNKIFSDDALIITGTVIQSKGTNDLNQSNAKVVYNRQTKQQYLSNLKRAFLRNKYIDVKFTQIGIDGVKGPCGWVTQSKNNPAFYGVRLRQEWRSSRYNDDGYVFLLWDFRNPDEPVIQVRTWQPTMKGSTELPPEEIFDIVSVEDMIN